MPPIRNNRRKLVVLGVSLLMLVASFAIYYAINKSEYAAGRKMSIIPAQASEARLLKNEAGELVYHVTWLDGKSNDISPVEFAQLIELEFQERPLYLRILNVSSTAGLFWVGVGLLAQLIFTARMVVQWVASEKHKRSVVPPMFWWLSLIGASMLIVYFIWRRDAVGVLGQATGWFVYIRNLMLIHREGKAESSPIEALDEEPVIETQFSGSDFAVTKA